MYHIKRDGGWICGKSRKYWAYKTHGQISFSQAHYHADLTHCCGECKKRYYEILERIKDIIIVKDHKNSPPKKKSNQIIVEPGIKPYGS